MKAAWIACFAEDEAIERLEVISDTFLSLSAPIQCALAAWLSGRGTLQGQIRERLRANLLCLDAVLLKQTLVSRLSVESGWYAVLRVPGLQPQEDTALDLLMERGVVVHPGGFFGFSGQGWLVASLLARLEEFREGVEAIIEHFRSRG
jgi:aspartate/methionine/tyrosine aminotransferase